jgi:N-acetylglucosamine kinase-like BadF-type ATPase
MKLIVDSGSSKASWALIKNKQFEIYETDGLNPHFIDERFFDSQIEILKSKFDLNLISNIEFYGAGCGQEFFSNKIVAFLQKAFVNAKFINVENDVMGASISLFSGQKGIACILGTGSNSCIFDTNTIVENLPAPGYILGDEGAGTFLGKRLLRDFLYNRLPNEMMDFLKKDLKLNEEDIYKNIYSNIRPNRYLASFAPIFDKFKYTAYAYETLVEGFEDFIKFHILPYEHYKNYPIGAVGSIGFVFQDALKIALKKYDLELSVVYKQPIDGLVNKELSIH